MTTMSAATYRETLATYLDSPVEVPAAQTTSDLLEQLGVVVNLLAARIVALEKTEAARELREKLHNAERIDAEYDIAKRLAALEQRRQLSYEGTWDETKAYTAGSFVTHQGSLWFAEDTNLGVRPGAGSTAWKLAVKRGKGG